MVIHMANEVRCRIGHCCPDAPNVDVHVDGNPAFENVAFGDISDYATLDPGTHEVRVVPTGTDDTVIETNVELEGETSYTVLATGMLENIQPTIFTDEPGDVPSDKAHVRCIHTSPDAPNVSVSVAGGPELFADLGFREATDYAPVDAGTYDLEVRPTGSDDVVLALDGLSFEGGSAYSAVAIGQVSDDSLDAVLTQDAIVSMPADD